MRRVPEELKSNSRLSNRAAVVMCRSENRPRSLVISTANLCKYFRTISLYLISSTFLRSSISPSPKISGRRNESLLGGGATMGTKEDEDTIGNSDSLRIPRLSFNSNFRRGVTKVCHAGATMGTRKRRKYKSIQIRSVFPSSLPAQNKNCTDPVPDRLRAFFHFINMASPKEKNRYFSRTAVS